jgi:tyrosine-protein phosphatase SIW14
MHDFRIRTVISLRDGVSDADKKEESLCMAHGLNFHRLAPVDWKMAKDGTYPIDANLAKFRSVMSDPANHPVLIHCFAGIHRTGSYCAIFRMDYNNWSKEQALHEMVQKGYTILKDHVDVQQYFNQYRPQPIAVRTKLAVSPSLSAN